MSTALASSRKWIVVADDDYRIRELLTRVLTNAGYRTVEARDGLDTIIAMRSVIPDLVILDLRMPELTGQEVLHTIRTTPILQRIPVIIVSGFLDDVASAVPPGLSIVGRLAKPVDPGALLKAVQAVLERRQDAPPAPPSL